MAKIISSTSSSRTTDFTSFSLPRTGLPNTKAPCFAGSSSRKPTILYHSWGFEAISRASLVPAFPAPIISIFFPSSILCIIP